MSLQEAAGTTADGGVSSAESTVDGDLTTCTESGGEQQEGLGSCDEAAS